MKRSFPIVLGALLALVIFQISSLRLQSHIIRPLTGGLANDPNESSCVSCHQYGVFNDPNRIIVRLSNDSAGLANSSSIVSNTSQYTPNYTQWVSVELVGANGNNPDYGFQFTALKSANDSMAGSFSLINTHNTSMETDPASVTGVRNYVGHANASSNKVWVFRWSTPDTGNVTFYYNGNFGNGDNQTTGDSIFHGSFTLTRGLPSGISNVSNIHAVSVYPVPFAQTLNADLYLNASSPLTITLLSMEGQAIKELYSGSAAQGRFSRSFEIGDISAGVYFVKIQSGNDAKVIKVLKF